MTPEHIKDKLKLQIAVNALLELRTEAQSGSLEMCTIDAALGNIGVKKEYIKETPGYLYQFPTTTPVKAEVL
jgi:hypothetical protein|tara:strand:- start:406 stop:621 length:216 start_codon:yes stop_codon:yes gene_type:complete